MRYADTPAMMAHGGRLRAAAAQYHIPLHDWLDLSTGINPMGWPVPPVPASCWQRLPEDDDELENAAREYYGCRRLLPVAGSQAAIQALPRLRDTSRVGVLHPSYNEHAHAWRVAGHRVVEFDHQSVEESLPQIDVLIIVNPNNPTGHRLDAEKLLRWHTTLTARGGWLIVDEAFVDATPQLSIVTHTEREGLIVLRSLGKFFGLAGARVGFVCAQSALLNALRAYLGPWPIGAPSRWVATRALRDYSWQTGTREFLRTASARLTDTLTSHAIPVSGGCDYFLWTRDKNTPDLHERLARKGILTRAFEQPASLRWGLPGDEHAWKRLENALDSLQEPVLP